MRRMIAEPDRASWLNNWLTIISFFVSPYDIHVCPATPPTKRESILLNMAGSSKQGASFVAAGSMAGASFSTTVNGVGIEGGFGAGAVTGAAVTASDSYEGTDKIPSILSA